MDKTLTTVAIDLGSIFSRFKPKTMKMEFNRLPFRDSTMKKESVKPPSYVVYR